MNLWTIERLHSFLNGSYSIFLHPLYCSFRIMGWREQPFLQTLSTVNFIIDRTNYLPDDNDLDEFFHLGWLFGDVHNFANNIGANLRSWKKRSGVLFHICFVIDQNADRWLLQKSAIKLSGSGFHLRLWLSTLFCYLLLRTRPFWPNLESTSNCSEAWGWLPSNTI